MDPNNLPGNSDAAKRNPEKKIEKVIEGSVHRRQAPMGRRLMTSARGAFESVATEVLIPALKATITDAISRGVEQLLFGSQRPNSPDSYRPSNRTNYQSYSSQQRRNNVSYGTGSPVRNDNQRRRPSDFPDEVTFPTRSQAERVLGEMMDNLDAYGTVSIADMVEMCGEVPETGTDVWGWRHLHRGDAYVRRLRNGDYYIELPRPQEIGTV